MASVSVVIPTYNRSDLLREAVDSALRQTHSDLEVLIVDDGSTDHTASVTKQISDSRIRYFYQENRGQSSARNLGLSKARGEYVAFLDEDDLWPSEYLETMIRELEEHKEYGAAYTRVIEMRPDGTRKEMSSPMRYRSGWITRYFFEFSPCLMPSATCFRRSVWNGVFWDEALKRSPDYDVFLRISTKTQFLSVLSTFVLKRAMPDSISSTINPTGVLDGARTLERFYFQLGGSKFVAARVAKHKISHRYRKAAKLASSCGCKDAATVLFRKAVSYYPLDIRLYFNMLFAVLRTTRSRTTPKWQMPEPLPPYITVGRKAH